VVGVSWGGTRGFRVSAMLACMFAALPCTVSSQSDSTSRERLQQGITLLAAGSPAEAIDSLLRGLMADPDRRTEGLIRLRLAAAYRQIGDLGAAVLEAREAGAAFQETGDRFNHLAAVISSGRIELELESAAVCDTVNRARELLASFREDRGLRPAFDRLLGDVEATGICAPGGTGQLRSRSPLVS